MLVKEKKKQKLKENWILWWIVSPELLDYQVANYQTLPFRNSARAGAVAALAISVAITVLFIAFKAAAPSALWDELIAVVLAIFIYFGHRWAMIGAMVYWTVEKLAAIYLGIAPSHAMSGAPIFTSIIWWCFYMHCFYVSFRVEQLRRSRPQLSRPELVF